MLGRYAPVSLLALAARAWACVLAALGTAAAAYGVAAALVTAMEVEQLHADAARAAWRSVYRCAQEGVFGVFLSWRADPMAMAVARPLQNLRGAVERGVADWAEIGLLWQSPVCVGAGPVVGAARQAADWADLVGVPP